jgi:ABC-2 type transport system permease protein
MKLWYSFTKELNLSAKSWYFYIEMGMAVVLLLILIFLVPEKFENRSSEYLYLDLPKVVKDQYREALLEKDLDESSEWVEVKANKKNYRAELYETDESKIYLLENMEALNAFSGSERVPTVHVHVNKDSQIIHTYYLQGYETQKLKNLLLVFHNQKAGLDVIDEYSDNIVVRSIYQNIEPLSDRQNLIPVFLTFNGSLMSLFIISAYIFLDKNEGIIKAYAVTASSVWHYLLSKIGVILLTSIATTLIITIPVMGFQPDYLTMILFLITSGFFAASLGLYITSFYKDIIQAFGALYIVIVIMMMPNISYFTPSWDPDWIKIIPSYIMLQSFKEIISINGNIDYVRVASLGFAVLGLDIFVLANYRFKKTLTL